ncbi:hypothetical protein F5146DRAFT_997883 [Armillaria mellea]|nr:hypothetical protein F5146DRAFT_997883 [Armillaria mellea]
MALSSHVLGGPAILSSSLVPLPTLNKADYTNIRFWTKSSYTEYQKMHKDNNELGTDIITRYSFLEDVDGNLVPAEHLNLISIKSQQCWFSLLRVGNAPAKWRAKDNAASVYYQHKMESEFIEFHFGADGWKLEKYSKVANSDSNDDQEELKDDNNNDSDPDIT